MMPQMPGLPSLDKNSVEKSAELDAPVHDDKPSIIDPLENKSVVTVPSVPKTGIEVVATRKGFYNQNRKKEGDKFFIKDESEFGEWFKCVDPLFERKRNDFLKDKKAKK